MCVCLRRMICEFVCVNKIYTEVCVEIPVPDTDCQCLEKQFL